MSKYDTFSLKYCNTGSNLHLLFRQCISFIIITENQTRLFLQTLFFSKGLIHVNLTEEWFITSSLSGPVPPGQGHPGRVREAPQPPRHQPQVPGQERLLRGGRSHQGALAHNVSQPVERVLVQALTREKKSVVIFSEEEEERNCGQDIQGHD